MAGPRKPHTRVCQSFNRSIAAHSGSTADRTCVVMQADPALFAKSSLSHNCAFCKILFDLGIRIAEFFHNFDRIGTLCARHNIIGICIGCKFLQVLAMLRFPEGQSSFVMIWFAQTCSSSYISTGS